MNEIMRALTKICKDHEVLLSIEYLPITSEWYASAFKGDTTLFVLAGDSAAESCGELVEKLEAWIKDGAPTKAATAG